MFIYKNGLLGKWNFALFSTKFLTFIFKLILYQKKEIIDQYIVFKKKIVFFNSNPISKIVQNGRKTIK